MQPEEELTLSEEIPSGTVVFAIQSYVADANDVTAMNLVEGERVYIIGKRSTICLLQTIQEVFYVNYMVNVFRKWQC